MIPQFEYHRPASLQDALELLENYNGKAKPLAGGTDLIVQMRDRKAAPGHIVDLAHLKELDYIVADRELVRIGALTRIASIQGSELITRMAPILARATDQFASWQIRNIGTIGGNLCNASPAADTAPPLMVLGARVRTKSASRERDIPLEQFFEGPGQTALDPAELVTEVAFKAPTREAQWSYFKLGRRSGNTLSIVSLAATFDVDGGEMCRARIALGAVAPVPLRPKRTEAMLEGAKLDVETGIRAGELVAAEVAPISDVRASADYRTAMSSLLVRKSIEALMGASKS